MTELRQDYPEAIGSKGLTARSGKLASFEYFSYAARDKSIEDRDITSLDGTFVFSYPRTPDTLAYRPQSSEFKLLQFTSAAPSMDPFRFDTATKQDAVPTLSNPAMHNQTDELHTLSKEDRSPTFVNYRKAKLPWLAPSPETAPVRPETTMPHVPGAFDSRLDRRVDAIELSPLQASSRAVASPGIDQDPAVRIIGSMPSLYRKTSYIAKKSCGSLRSNARQLSVEELKPGHPNESGQPNLSELSRELRPSESTAASDRDPSVLPLTCARPPTVAGFIAGPEYRASVQLAGPTHSDRVIDVSNQAHHLVEDALQKSIAGLETLMHEAINLTHAAVDHNRSDMLPEIFKSATQVLQEAENVRADNNIPTDTSVTVLFDHDNLSPSESEQEPVANTRNYSTHRYKLPRNHSHSPSRPHEQSSQRGIIPKDGESFDHNRTTSAGPQTIWDDSSSDKHMGQPDRTSDSSTARTPPHFYQRPSNIDWAYGTGQGGSAATPRALLQRKRTPELAQPEPIQLSQSNQTNLVLRTGYDAEGRVRTRPNHSPSGSSASNSRPSGSGAANSPTSGATDPPAPNQKAFGRSATQGRGQAQNWGRDKYDEQDYMTSDTLKGVHHLTLRDDQKFSLHRYYRSQPIARNWSTLRKRITAAVACINTALLGILIGIYSGEVPSIQYQLADQSHMVILGNVFLYIGMAITTFFFWPLPLLHGRKPYTLGSLAIALPLQFPQAVMVMQQRNGNYSTYQFGLLFSRAVSGLALGFAFINVKTTLLDLFGASLQSEAPHGELVILDDVRRHGGGMGLWIGIWSWCFIGSLSVGFTIGAAIINSLNPQWGFWISVILMAIVLVLGVLTPETRRSAHRRILQEVELPNMGFSRRVARGEIRMHIKGDGPKWWWEEVTAGVYLTMRMMFQFGFAVMAIYVAWIYAEIVLIIVLLGNLLSRGYGWSAQHVGLGVLSIAIGALLAVPLSLGNISSRARTTGPRTDSMTFQPRITWTSHLVRRFVFMIMLPLSGIAYTIASGGPNVHFIVPILFAAAIGFFSNLALSECHGLIMETYDTSDLQPGTNSRHRLQSMAPAQKRRRTTYSSYPRVSAGFFAAHSLGFLLAAAAVGVGGVLTRTVGYQKATGITAGILFGLTLLLTAVLWRFKHTQVIPNELFSQHFGSTDANAGAEARRGSVRSVASDQSWRAVVIGNPSGKMRRMSMLELGSLSRWTEIRRLNRMLSRSSTQPLNPGWR